MVVLARAGWMLLAEFFSQANTSILLAANLPFLGTFFGFFSAIFQQVVPAAAWAGAAKAILGLEQQEHFKGAASSSSPQCGQESKAGCDGIAVRAVDRQEEAEPGQEDGF